MRLVVAGLAILAGIFPTVRAQAPLVVRPVAVSPDPATRLASGQNLNVRIAYESDQPLRFQAEGYFRGGRHVNLATNGSPAYPPGKGEAIVWLFGQPGAQIDEIHIVVYNAGWKKLQSVPLPVPAEWHAGVPPAPVAAWVQELENAQQELVNEAARHPTAPRSLLGRLWVGLSGVLVAVAFLSVPGYPAIQLYALWKLRGPARLLSALPVSFMVPVYAFCLYALSQGSNLWPLYAIFASPAALAITLTVVLVARRKARAASA